MIKEIKMLPTKYDWNTFFKSLRVQNERIISIYTEKLQIAFSHIPQFMPTYDVHFGSGVLSEEAGTGVMALTNYRLIIAMIQKNNIWRYIYIPAINYFSERPLNQVKPTWPYQAMINVPGGIVIAIQIEILNQQTVKVLSSFLNDAFMRLRINRDDESTSLIIEEERRRQEASSGSSEKYYDKPKKDS
jgi:hypothetical protein